MSMSRRASLVVCSVLVLSGWIFGQPPHRSSGSLRPEAPPPRRPTTLNVSSVIDTGVPVFPFLGQPKADGDGDLFFLPDGYDGVAIFELTLPDPSRSRMYRMAPGNSGADFYMGSAVSPSGTLHVLAEDVKKNFRIFTFDSNGDVKRSTRLDAPEAVSLLAFAVFQNDSFLVIGYRNATSGKAERKSYAALFSSSGTLLRDLTKGFGLKSGGLDAVGSVRDVPVVASEDGNLYLLGTDRVLVVSRSGEVVRRIKVPRPDPEKEPLQLWVSGGLLGVKLGDYPGVDKAVNPTFLVLDASTGREYGYFAPPAEARDMMPVRFTREGGFAFLEVDEQRKIRILTAGLP